MSIIYIGRLAAVFGFLFFFLLLRWLDVFDAFYVDI